MRITWIVPGFSSDETDWCIPALLDLARVVACRCDLTIVAMRYPFRKDTYPIGGATVISIGGGHRGVRHTPRVWHDTARAVRNTGCDLIHAFWAYEPGVIAAWASSSRPVVVTLAGGELLHLPEINYGLARRLRTRLLIRLALNRAAEVTAGSASLAEKARACSTRSPKQVPFGVDLTRWPYSTHDTSPASILSVGSLEPVKGHDVLLRVFARVREELPMARLRIVGGGRELQNLRRRAQELGLSASVELAGPVPHQDLPRIYAGASVFVQTSWHEAQGMAVLEAAACGLPLVGTRTGALADLAPSAALVAPAGDVDALAHGIVKVISDGVVASEMSRNARSLVENSYTVVACAENFLNLYRSLLGQESFDAGRICRNHGY